MKKIILLFVLIMFCFSQNLVVAKEITFIYINGSNNNDKKMANWFLKGVEKLHPQLKKQFEGDKESVKYFLNEGTVSIDEDPKVFFWGDKSKADLDFVKENLTLMRGVSPFISYQIRNVIAECFHDAIWVQKPHNMMPILEELDKSVKEEVENGNNVVLLGYSAGSFITIQYLFSKLAYVNLKEILELTGASKERLDFVNKNPKPNTCFYAFSASGLGTFSSEDKLILNQNEEQFRKNYLSIDKYTDTYCATDDSIHGVINFASPYVLFYSEIGDKNYQPNAYLKYLYKYLIEHDVFLLTANYCDDPLGFPTTKNLTNAEVEKLSGIKADSHLGFLYDYSDMISLRTAFGAHTSYWATSKRFSKMVLKAYIEGYKYQYDSEFQKKMLKKQRKRF